MNTEGEAVSGDASAPQAPLDCGGGEEPDIGLLSSTLAASVVLASVVDVGTVAAAVSD